MNSLSLRKVFHIPLGKSKGKFSQNTGEPRVAKGLPIASGVHNPLKTNSVAEGPISNGLRVRCIGLGISIAVLCPMWRTTGLSHDSCRTLGSRAYTGNFLASVDRVDPG
jgi:hypothetical protein